MRLIDADEAHKMIDCVGTFNGLLLHDAHDFIDKLPTIDAEPLPNGKWNVTDNGDRQCSVCGNRVDAIHYEDGTSFFSKTKHRYCGECGSRMDGDENETD